MTKETPMELSFGTVYLVEEMTPEEIFNKKQLGLFNENKREMQEFCPSERKN